MPRDAMREEDLAQQVRDGIRDPINLQADALLAIERMARNGHGPTFTQRSVGAGYSFKTFEEGTEAFCKAVEELEKECLGKGKA